LKNHIDKIKANKEILLKERKEEFNIKLKEIEEKKAKE